MTVPDMQQTRPATPEEDIKVLYGRVAKLNDYVSALIAPQWGAEAGLLPRDHPLHPAMRAPRPLTEGEKIALEAAGLPAATRVTRGVVAEAVAQQGEQPAPIDWQTIAERRERELKQVGEARRRAERERDEARQWARHGYEIGQKHCGWSDHGVAPAWLTEGWPQHIDSCEHLAQMAEFDEALTRVRAVLADPSVLDWRQRVRAAIEGPAKEEG